MKYRPMREYVLVKPTHNTEKKIGNIIVPGSVKQDLLPGEVVAVGSGYLSDDGKKHTPLEVKPGDSILYSEYAGKDVETAEGEKLLCMEERDIQLVVSSE